MWLNDPDTARSHLRQAIDHYDDVGDLFGLAHAHRTLAWCLGRQGERRAAVDEARRAVRLHVAAGDPAGQGLSLNSLGWQHAHLGEYELAARYCTEAIRHPDAQHARERLERATTAARIAVH